MNNKNIQGSTSKEVAYKETTQVSMNPSSADEEIDLTELFRAVWSGKLFIVAITFIFAVGSIFYALNQPNIYRASTLLSPASNQGGASGLAKMAGQFGGLASLAGINLGGGGTDKTGLALEVLKSRIFLENFIENHELLVPLMAVKNWNQVEDKLIYDDDIYDIKNKKWLRDVKAPLTAKPTPWESYEALNKILAVSVDKETGMITIAIEHFSPNIAKQWLSWLVADINTTMREQDKEEAQSSISFLNKKLEETQVSDMQTVFYQLIEEQTKTIMLAEVSKEYVLKTVDPANTPDDRNRPNRALMVVMGTMLGGILSVLFVLIRYFLNKENKENKGTSDLVQNRLTLDVK